MSRPGSGAVTTIAVLNFVFGGLGLLFSLCNVIGLIVVSQGGPPGGGGHPDVTMHLVNNVPGYFTVQVVQTVFGLLFDLTLLVTGFGLLWRQSWARYLLIGYGAVSLLLKIALLAYQFIMINPVADKFLDVEAAKIKNPQEQQGFRAGAKFGMYAGGPCLVGLMMVYPAVVILMMLLPSVGEYFRSDGRDYDEHDYDDRRRRGRDDYDDRRRFDRDRDDDRGGRPRGDGGGGGVYREEDEGGPRRRRWGDDE